MTSQVQTAAVSQVSSKERVFESPSDEKWPVPYALMFMVSISAVLWYGIYAAGSTLVSAIG